MRKKADFLRLRGHK